jgi:hypothetical protein
MFKNPFAPLQMSSKVTNKDQIFALAYKKKFFIAYHNEQNYKIMPKTIIFQIFYLSARVAYPLSLYCIKLARIEEIKNLTLGNL